MTSKLLLFITPALLLASSSGIDFYSAGDLHAKAAGMASKTAPASHSATVTQLEKYTNDHTLIAYRNADGKAELHEHESDLYLVLDGKATLVSGGTMLERKQTADGEFLGSGISNGESQVITKGDVVHIAPNLPHQIKVKSGESISYFVQKVKEQ